MERERRRLIVTGVVQGVGFRPFVYRIAHAHGLAGSVCNRGDAGVEIEIEGDPQEIEGFLTDLREKHPPLARIGAISVEEIPPTGEAGFRIVPSKDGAGSAGAIPPDIAICDECIADIFGDTRYRGYWATSCTNCGPRFTVIESLPYDRPRTSMRDFPMCADCRAEYTDPLDRRYHAQTIACPRCGPRLTFDGTDDDPIARAAAALKSGEIVAIKGIGGTHIACDATNADAVAELRARLGRPGQPFALMATEEILPRIAEVTEEEWALLRSPRRPIVVLRQRPGALPEQVAPGLHTVGVMLPYSGLHHLLFAQLETPLVMTSANRPGSPMLIENTRIEHELSGIVDHFLLHDRRIVARCDDSVVRISGGNAKLLRRSRGYVPEGFRIDLGNAPILALGPESDLAFALYFEGRVTMSQHIGTVDDLDTFAFLQEAIGHLRRITGAPPPRIVAHDLHPGFITTRYAAELAALHRARAVPVQHHVAHLASVLGEHGLTEAVGVVLDGYGYGTDGTAWGGEIFVAQDGKIVRAGTLSPVRLPGGDLAARKPARMAAAYLHAAGVKQEEIAEFLRAREMEEVEVEVVLHQLETGLNSPTTTSAGRFLDAVAALIGIARLRTYEGEPAMRLEAAASSGREIHLPVRTDERDGLVILDTVSAFLELYRRVGTLAPDDIAASAQAYLADGAARIAIELARGLGIGAIALSGGVAYNDAISGRIRQRIEEAGISYYTNELVPPGDGGIALGQAVIASGALEAEVPDAASAEEDQDPQPEKNESDHPCHGPDCNAHHTEHNP